MTRLLIPLITLFFAGWSVEALAQQKTAGSVTAPGPVNVLQDCWTTSLAIDPDPELELYAFDATTGFIDFLWKHKIIAGCSAYVAQIVIFACVDGKPFPSTGATVYTSPVIPFGPVSPIPGIPEIIFPPVTLTPGTLPPGFYDWFIVTECDDTGGTILIPRKDDDIDDQCGINVGRNPSTGLRPVIFGPEPLQAMDPDPGGSPSGRAPGESGTTRPWCFQVVAGGGGEGAEKLGLEAGPLYPGLDMPRQIITKEDLRRGYFDDQLNVQLLDDSPRMEVQQQQEPVPEMLEFVRNHPNPFRGETTIRYKLTEAGPITLTIYDALGRKVRVLVDEVKTEGEHEVTFDGQGLSAGVYFYYVETATKKYMGKMIHRE